MTIYLIVIATFTLPALHFYPEHSGPIAGLTFVLCAFLWTYKRRR